MPDAPDLRTAAAAVSTTWDATWGKVGVVELEHAMDPVIEALRVAALAAEATEPPPSISCALCGHLAAHFPDEPCPVGVDEGTICGCPGVPGSAPNPQGADEP